MIRAESVPCTTAAVGERRQAFEGARQCWPELDVRFEEFCAHLDQLGHVHELPPHVEALYLCIACGRGCDSACRQLEARHFPALRRYLARFDTRPEAIEDLLQQLRFRLLVGSRPRILSYRGRGSFDAWLRGVARSVAVDSIRVDLCRARRVRRCSQDATCREYVQAAPPPAPDEQLFQQRYARLVEQALRRSLQMLPSDRRQLLHHYYVSGLSIDQLGSLYSVNRSTAARRISRSVRSIQRALRKELTQRIGAPERGELEGWVPILYRRWGGDADGWLSSERARA